MAEREKSTLVRPDPGAAKPSPQEQSDWDAAHCGWCGSDRLKQVGATVDGIALFKCDECTRQQEAVMDLGKPVARIFPGNETETAGYRCGDEPPSGARQVPGKLPCGCFRLTAKRLNDGTRRCRLHAKRFKLALAFVEV